MTFAPWAAPLPGDQPGSRLSLEAAPSTVPEKFKISLKYRDRPTIRLTRSQTGLRPDRNPPQARHPPRLVPRSPAPRSSRPSSRFRAPGSGAEARARGPDRGRSGVREGPMLVDVMSLSGRYTPSGAGCGVRLPSASPISRFGVAPDAASQSGPQPATIAACIQAGYQLPVGRIAGKHAG